MRYVHWCAVAALLGGPLAFSAGLAPASLNDWQFVGDPEISPDGSRIVYVVARVDSERDDYESDLWLIDGDAAPRPFVTAHGEDLHPRWSPDGKRLAFASTRAGKRQIFVLETSGGEAWQLTKETEGVGGFAWSPDGARIAYTARPASPEQGTPPASGRVRVTDRLYFRSDGAPGFSPPLRSRLWVVDVKPEHATALGPMTDGSVEPSEPAWSADGQALIYSALTKPDDLPIDGDTELFRIAVAKNATPTAMTDRRGPDANPAVAPKGDAVAWTGYDFKTPPRSSTTQRLYVKSAADSEPRALTANFDRNVGETILTDIVLPRGNGPQLAWSGDGRQLLFLAADRGRSRLFAVPAQGGDVREISTGLAGDLREFTVANNGRIAAIFGSPAQPYDVWTLDRPGAKWRQRTTQGAASLKGAALAHYEPLSFDSFDNQTIQGWLITPPDFDAGGKYPLILYIHGGPHTLYGEGFFHEFQVLAARGYLILIANPRGSTGYGEAFANVIQYHYPGDDYRDLMGILDSVIARGFVDEKRVGVGGGSGGGLLTAWIVGHTPRFAAALAERPVIDWTTEATVSDISGYVASRWFRDLPWRDIEDYRARSPLSYVDQVTTPVLVIQSEQDYRTPMNQGISFYTALRMQGKEARLALFPSSSHGLSRNGPPSQRIDRLKIISDWFDEHLRSSR